MSMHRAGDLRMLSVIETEVVAVLAYTRNDEELLE
jgi:hypothetical protein